MSVKTSYLKALALTLALSAGAGVTAAAQTEADVNPVETVITAPPIQTPEAAAPTVTAPPFTATAPQAPSASAPLPALQPQTVPLQATSLSDLAPVNSQFCTQMMTGFPDESLVNRYQFFRLIQSMKSGVDSDMRAGLSHYGEKVDLSTENVVDTVQNLSDPVVLQSSPAFALSNASHLIRYAEECNGFISSQISAIEYAEPSVKEASMEEILAEDAVFLRALIVQSMETLSAGDHPVYGPAMRRYEGATIYIRNEAEFIGFEAELDALTAETISEIDDKLALHLSMVEGDINNESISTSSDMLESMNKTSKQESHRGVYNTLYRILNSRY